MTTARQPDAGFTLIETLVALAILAFSTVALLGATEAHVARIGALETRAAAQWVTENHLAELTLGIDPTLSPPAMRGIAFTVSDARTASDEPELERVDLSAIDPVDGRTYGRLIGFLDKGGKVAEAGG